MVINDIITDLINNYLIYGYQVTTVTDSQWTGRRTPLQINKKNVLTNL